MFFAPAAVHPGAHLRLIAPSSPFDRDDFDKGVSKLSKHYHLSFDDGVFNRREYLAGDDARREAELRTALLDPQVDAILAIRGGYGAGRLLPSLSPELVRQSGKILIGFSDITALHALWARAEVRSLHADMVGGLGRGDEMNLALWRSALEGRLEDPPGPLHTLVHGRDQKAREGPLLGGNLSLLAALAGTPFAMPLKGAVLFLEEVDEALYRIDRMLTTLVQSGTLNEVSAVVLGQFSRCGAIAPLVSERLGGLGVPIVAGLQSGHGQPNRPLPLGARVRVDPRSAHLSLLEQAVTSH